MNDIFFLRNEQKKKITQCAKLHYSATDCFALVDLRYVPAGNHNHTLPANLRMFPGISPLVFAGENYKKK